jgi:hypothetical protein
MRLLQWLLNRPVRTDREYLFVGEYADSWQGVIFSVKGGPGSPHLKFVFPRLPDGFRFPSEGRNHPYDPMRVARAFKMRVRGHLSPPGSFGQNGRLERELIISEVLDCREVLDR